MDAPAIALATADAQRRAAFRLRYRVYCHAMRKPYPTADHARCELHDELDADAFVLIAVHQGEAVATARLISCAAPSFDAAAAARLQLDRFPGIPPHRISSVSRLIIDARWRASGLFHALAHRLYELGRDRLDSRLDLIHTNARLIGLFEHIGYRRCGAPFFDPDSNLTQHPMALVMHDIDHLRAVGSPLVPLAEARAGDADEVRMLQALVAAPAYAVAAGVS